MCTTLTQKYITCSLRELGGRKKNRKQKGSSRAGVVVHYFDHSTAPFVELLKGIDESVRSAVEDLKAKTLHVIISIAEVAY